MGLRLKNNFITKKYFNGSRLGVGFFYTLTVQLALIFFGWRIWLIGYGAEHSIFYFFWDTADCWLLVRDGSGKIFFLFLKLFFIF